MVKIIGLILWKGFIGLRNVHIKVIIAITKQQDRGTTWHSNENQHIATNWNRYQHNVVGKSIWHVDCNKTVWQVD